MQTLVIYKLGFEKNCHTFTSMLLINTVLCGEFPNQVYKLYVFRYEIRLSILNPEPYTQVVAEAADGRGVLLSAMRSILRVDTFFTPKPRTPLCHT